MFMEALYASLSFTWFELSFFSCFLLGFAFLRLEVLSSKTKDPDKDFRLAKKIDTVLKDAVESCAQTQHIVAVWKDCCSSAPTPAEFLKPVIQALAEHEPEELVDHISKHVRTHAETLCNARTANIALDALARIGKIELMEKLGDTLRQLNLQPNLQTFEVLVGAYATAAMQDKVKEVCSEVAASRMHLSPRGLSLAIKGFLKNGMIEATVEKFDEMKQLGYQLPTFAVTQLLRVACDAGRSKEVYERIKDVSPLNTESVGVLLESCQKSKNFQFAQQVEHEARAQQVPFSFSTYDSLLKMYTVKGDPRVLDLFEEMHKTNIRATEGLCAALLARCAESKFLRFADEIVRYTRANHKMTITLYSALMKVYAYCNMYDKACDLYQCIREDGLEPDAMMCGCLMKFAVECGRTDLSRQIAEIAPCLEIQNYMSLIRAAGRDKDVARAFQVLDRLKASNVPTDAALHNCVLDVCVSAGDMDRARKLVLEMRQVGHHDVITYNTLIKGYCHAGDLKSAKACTDEMAQDGIQPNDVSYNCLLNACVHAHGGNLTEAWATIERMKKSGVAVDHYTVSIMMKSLKRGNNPKEVVRCLELLDQAKIDVCSDEILLNSVLETCTRHKEIRRLETILNQFSKSNLRASVSTYGSLIKACGSLKNLPQCWAHWKTMQERGLEPTAIVLGCMLDALVCNGQVEKAVDLLNEWKARVPPNAIMYSTITKGFASSGQHKRAMATLREIRAANMKMTTVVYNSVIDAQARAGAMEEISELFEMMEADGVTPDSISWATLVKAHCVQGDLNKAFEIFRLTLKNSATKDSMIYNNILDGCIRHSRFDLAETLLEEMETTDIVPSNYTFGIVVKLYSRRRSIEKAFEVIERMSTKFKIAPNNQVRTCLMCACLNANKPDRAMQVFEELKASPSGADGKAYSVLISGLARYRQISKAVSLVEEAYGLAGSHRIPRGQALEAGTLEKLIVAMGQRGLTESVGIPLLKRLQAAGVPCSGRLVSTVLSSADQVPSKEGDQDWRQASCR